MTGRVAGTGSAALGAPPTRQRWLARAALLAAAAAVVVPLGAAELRGSVAMLLVGMGGAVLSLAAAWWFLAHRGAVRWLAAVVAVLGPLVAVILFARADLLWVVPVTVALWGAAVTLGAAALQEPGAAGVVEREVPPPDRPYLIMNPRSGGGKVERFDLARRARAAGAQVVLLDRPGMDVVELASAAVADGADLLGVAGGDGTQALVAGVAAEHDLPFMVISAGTRNHFALDLGLDRDDPARCLQALTDGVELRVDLGSIAGRTFVNNASFGAYAAVVQSPAYRDDKTRTTLEMLPDVLSDHQETRLRVVAAGREIVGPQAVLVSDNPYSWEDIAGLGRRPRIDRGVLGVLAISVSGVGDAVGLVRGLHARGIWRAVCDEVIVDSDAPEIPVGVDGEALSLPTPVHCTIRPAALRVRVPRHRPGVRPERSSVDWSRLRMLALGRGPVVVRSGGQ